MTQTLESSLISKCGNYAYFQGAVVGNISDTSTTFRMVTFNGDYKLMYEDLVKKLYVALEKLNKENKANG